MSEKDSKKPTPPKPDQGIQGRVTQGDPSPPKPDQSISGAVIKGDTGKGKTIKK